MLSSIWNQLIAPSLRCSRLICIVLCVQMSFLWETESHMHTRMHACMQVCTYAQTHPISCLSIQLSMDTWVTSSLWPLYPMPLWTWTLMTFLSVTLSIYPEGEWQDHRSVLLFILWGSTLSFRSCYLVSHAQAAVHPALTSSQPNIYFVVFFSNSSHTDGSSPVLICISMVMSSEKDPITTSVTVYMCGVRLPRPVCGGQRTMLCSLFFPTSCRF